MLIAFGQFGRPHGVRGEIRFRPFNPDSALLAKGRAIRIGRSPSRCDTFDVERIRFDAKGAIIKLDGFFDRDQVKVLTGQTWYEMREAFPALDADEFYLVDLIGMAVVRENGASVGVIRDVLEYGPYETFAIKGRGKEYLVPNVSEFVLAIDIDARVVTIRPIDGLLD
ncbi:MAG: ribosome maturation factor RimM [Myxococcota bacterium]|nr:ribosome maturation factor RimM [Myxococcota bacterium]